jgi:DNA repair exonuclease SbcCD ATPase subunit/predicted MPP superfamily phosphohydrolase
VADIHIRLTKRFDEYNEAFNKLYEEVKKTPKTTLITVLGDVFHSKSDLSPECVQMASNFLNSLSNLRPTILVSGNHDATLSNKNRLDSLTPIVNALNNPNLFYLKDNGLYSVGNILFNNMSVFSEPENYISYDDIPKNHKNEYLYHIALYHGAVNSALTDLGFQLVNKAMPIERFDGYHIALLGDIHKKQDLQHFDNSLSKPAVHYPGSFLQQNHGESIDGHGFSLWDLKSKTHTHINIPNDYGFFTVEVNKGKLVTDLTNIPKKARVFVKCFESVASEVKSVVSTIKTVSDVDEISYGRVDSDTDPAKLANNVSVKLSDIADVTYQNKLLSDFLRNKCQVVEKTLIDSVLSINTDMNNKIEKDDFAKNVKWKPKKFEFDNTFSYGEGNVVDFSKTKDVMGLFGPNACGKSSIFSTLAFCLFDKFDRGYKAVNILNIHKTNFRCKFNFEINGVDFFIERKGVMDKKGNVKVDVKFWKVENGKDVDLNGEARRNTNDVIKEYLGTYEDFVLTSLSVQNAKNSVSFIDMGQSERKDLLSQFIGVTIFDRLLEVATEESKNISVSLKNSKKEDYETKLQSYNNESSSLTSVYDDENILTTRLTEERKSLNDQVLEQTKLLVPVNVKLINVDDSKKLISVKEGNIKTLRESNIDIDGRFVKVDEAIKNLTDQITDLENKDITNSFKTYQKNKSELSRIEQTLEVKKVEVGNKVKKLDMLKKHEYDPNCKFCVNSVFVKDAEKIAVDLESEKIVVKNTLQERNKVKKEVEDLSWVVDAQENYTNFLKKQNEYKDGRLKLERTQDQNKTTISKLESELATLNKNIDDYNKQIETIESNLKIQTIIDTLNQNLKNVDFNINQKNKKLLEIGGRKIFLQSQINLLVDTIAKNKKMEKEYETYSLYIKSVNRDGLPYMIIANAVPEIEHEVNNILNQIVEFHVDIETDGKNVTPYIVYDTGRWPIEMGSGFEKFISSLAIRVALINISNLPRPNFLIIDEGWGTMDSVNLGQVKLLLQFLRSNFDFIIVISHLDFIKDAVDHLIEVKKDNGISSVNFV